MISKLIGEYLAAILLLLTGLALFIFGLSYDAAAISKIGATMLGSILILVNGLKLLWLICFDGKEDEAKFATANPYTKKYQAVNVERWITSLTLVGLVLATGFMFMAFTIAEKPKEIIFDELHLPDMPEEEPPILTHKKLPPPPPPPPPIIKIVPDEKVLDDEPKIKVITIDELEEITIPEPEVVFDGIVEDMLTEAKEPEVVEEEAEIFIIVEEMPSFKGGETALLKYLYSNIKYPAIAKENGIQGIIYVQFIVNEDGDITDVIVPRDIGGGCGDEAARVVNAMPKWNPGKQRGKAVKVKFGVPVRFKLQ